MRLKTLRDGEKRWGTVGYGEKRSCNGNAIKSQNQKISVKMLKWTKIYKKILFLDKRERELFQEKLQLFVNSQVTFSKKATINNISNRKYFFRFEKILIYILSITL